MAETLWKAVSADAFLAHPSHSCWRAPGIGTRWGLAAAQQRTFLAQKPVLLSNFLSNMYSATHGRSYHIWPISLSPWSLNTPSCFHLPAGVSRKGSMNRTRHPFSQFSTSSHLCHLHSLCPLQKAVPWNQSGCKAAPDSAVYAVRHFVKSRWQEGSKTGVGKTERLEDPAVSHRYHRRSPGGWAEGLVTLLCDTARGGARRGKLHMALCKVVLVGLGRVWYLFPHTQPQADNSHTSPDILQKLHF